jgi:hypothetical protein
MFINVSPKIAHFPVILPVSSHIHHQGSLHFAWKGINGIRTNVEDMPRELSGQDLDILMKLAPECTDLVCGGSGVRFRSLLPPLANHFSMDASDFAERLERLSDRELEYLLSLIRDGSESLGCVPPDYMNGFVDLLRSRLGMPAAAEVVEIYQNSAQCPE